MPISPKNDSTVNAQQLIDRQNQVDINLVKKALQERIANLIGDTVLKDLALENKDSFIRDVFAVCPDIQTLIFEYHKKKEATK